MTIAVQAGKELGLGSAPMRCLMLILMALAVAPVPVFAQTIRISTENDIITNTSAPDDLYTFSVDPQRQFWTDARSHIEAVALDSGVELGSRKAEHSCRL